MLDISICATKVRGRPKGRPSEAGKGVLELPQKKRILHVIKNLHHLAGVCYRKANNYSWPLGQRSV